MSAKLGEWSPICFRQETEKENGVLPLPNQVPIHIRQFLNFNQMFRFAEKCLELCFVQSGSGQNSCAQETTRDCEVFCHSWEEPVGGGGRVESWNRQRALRMGMFNFDFKSFVVWDMALWLPPCDTERLEWQQGKGSVPFEPVTELMRNCSRTWNVEFGN